LDPTSNLWKTSKKEYDETLYPLDHNRAGQIRDFTLFNDFVKVLPAGVVATCVLDCCHSGSVLDLPYSYQPTPAGTIRARQNFNSLSNLALLYLLAGGALPGGGLFHDVTNNIQDATGLDDLSDLQGIGMDEEGYGGVEGESGGDNYGQDAYDGNQDGGVDDGGGEGFTDDVGGGNYDSGGGDGDYAATAAGDAGGYYSAPEAAAAGDDGFFGGGTGDYAIGGGGDDAVGEDVDCSCLGDVLQGLLEE